MRIDSKPDLGRYLQRDLQPAAETMSAHLLTDRQTTTHPKAVAQRRWPGKTHCLQCVRSSNPYCNFSHEQTVDDHPKGYPKLAAFMNSSDNFLMARRFSFLHSRVLLHRQDELAEMEKALIAMDDEDQDLDQLSLQSRRRDDQRPDEPSRKSLMTKIDNKLKDYGRMDFTVFFPSKV